MRRRHNKAQYVARERAHLAPSMPHVRREQGLPGTHPNPVQPTVLHLRRTQNLHPKATEKKTRTSSNFQVCRELCVCVCVCVVGREEECVQARGVVCYLWLSSCMSDVHSS